MNSHAPSASWSIPLKMSAEIEEHGAECAVALESAPLFLHPRGLDYAAECISLCHSRDMHAAFIVMVDGILWIGASLEQLKLVASQVSESSNSQPPPTSATIHSPRATAHNGDRRYHASLTARDIPMAMQFKWSGGLQVSGTAIMAHLAGIAVCSVTRIGLLDLHELSRHPLSVVSSGIVADGAQTTPPSTDGTPAYSQAMARSLAEYELPLVGYRSDSWPLYSATRDDNGGVSVSRRVEQAAEVADLLRITRLLNYQRALLVSHPLPTNTHGTSPYADIRLSELVHNTQLAVEIADLLRQ